MYLCVVVKLRSPLGGEGGVGVRMSPAGRSRGYVGAEKAGCASGVGGTERPRPARWIPKPAFHSPASVTSVSNSAPRAESPPPLPSPTFSHILLLNPPLLKLRPPATRVEVMLEEGVLPAKLPLGGRGWRGCRTIGFLGNGPDS